jgi:hypothetical protein
MFAGIGAPFPVYLAIGDIHGSEVGGFYSKTSFPVGSRCGVLFIDCRKRDSSW